MNIPMLYLIHTKIFWQFIRKNVSSMSLTIY